MSHRAITERNSALKWSPMPVLTKPIAAYLQSADRHSSCYVAIHKSLEKKVITRSVSLARACAEIIYIYTSFNVVIQTLLFCSCKLYILCLIHILINPGLKSGNKDLFSMVFKLLHLILYFLFIFSCSLALMQITS